MYMLKDEVNPVLQLSTAPWRRIGEAEIQLHAFLTAALDGGDWSAPHPSRFTPPGKEPIHWSVVNLEKVITAQFVMKILCHV